LVAWHAFSEPVRAQVRACLETKLSEEFDLTIEEVRTWSFDANLGSVLAWAFKISIVVVVATSAAIGSILAISLYTDPASPSGKLLRQCFLPLFFLALFGPGLYKCYKIRGTPECYPYWRMRRRDSSSNSATSAQTAGRE
jgi:hypothetical protein